MCRQEDHQAQDLIITAIEGFVNFGGDRLEIESRMRMSVVRGATKIERYTKPRGRIFGDTAQE